MNPAPAQPAADPDPDQRQERPLVEVTLLDDPVEDLFGHHQGHRRRARFLQGVLEPRRIQQPESGVEVVAVEALVVLVDFAGVDDGPQPQLRFRPRDRGVVLDEQCGQHRNQTAKHHRLRHVVVRPDQDEHAVASVGQALQVLGAYPGRQQRSLYQLV